MTVAAIVVAAIVVVTGMVAADSAVATVKRAWVPHLGAKQSLSGHRCRHVASCTDVRQKQQLSPAASMSYACFCRSVHCMEINEHYNSNTRSSGRVPNRLLGHRRRTTLKLHHVWLCGFATSRKQCCHKTQTVATCTEGLLNQRTIEQTMSVLIILRVGIRVGLKEWRLIVLTLLRDYCG